VKVIRSPFSPSAIPAASSQISLPQERVADVRRYLANYRKLKAALEKMCRLNQQLLRSEKAGAKTRGRK